MPPVDQPQIDRLTLSLLRAYEAAEELINAELQAILNEPKQFRRRVRLRELAVEIERLKSELDQQVESWANDELRTIYQMGATVTSRAIEASFAWTQTHEAAVKWLAKQTTSHMLRATKHMSDDAKRLIRASSKEAALMKLLTGQTAVQAARGLRAELQTNAISAVIYKNGARHGIADYSDTVLRTTTATAYNTGTLLEGKEHGAKYAIAYDGLECGLHTHDGSPKANNLILPIGGAMRSLISHPRCRRAWSILMDIRSKKQAEGAMAAGTYSTTAAQDSAQRSADALRLGQQRRAARLRARQARLAARAQRVGTA
jgi:hypothetical protein